MYKCCHIGCFANLAFRLSLQPYRNTTLARVAESVDALVSNTNGRKAVPVRPRPRVPYKIAPYHTGRGLLVF